MPEPFLIATRGSALALAQARQTQAQIQAAFPELAVELRVLKTTGDKLQTATLAQSNLPKGLFTKEIEESLLARETDLAVHSLKDLPTALPPGLALGAVSRRADARDVLLGRAVESAGRPWSLAALPAGAVVATSSTRRAAQLRARRPDVSVVPIRGNVGTRLRKLAETREFAATLLAAAGLERLGCEFADGGELRGPDVPPGLRAAALSPHELLPCVGQAALGYEIRAGDARAARVCAALNDFTTERCVTAERAFLAAMGGGCQSPVAALAEVVGAALWLRGESFVTGAAVAAEVEGTLSDAVALGEKLAAKLRA